MAVRPEAFVISDKPEMDGDNRLEGTVVEAIFLGSIIDYRVDIGGTTVRVQGSRYDFREVGSRIRLIVPVAECALIPEASADGFSNGAEI